MRDQAEAIELEGVDEGAEILLHRLERVRLKRPR